MTRKNFTSFDKGLSLAILFIVFVQMLSAQNVSSKAEQATPQKYILVYKAHPYGSGLANAFRIIDNKVQIDSGYNEIANTFTVSKVVKMRSNILFSEILSLKKSYLSSLEKHLHNKVDCDSALPYIIKIVDGDTTETFILSEYGNCPGIGKKKLLIDLYNYFSSMGKKED